MENILVIIPLHIFDDSVGELLIRSIKSVPSKMNILISTTQQLYSEQDEKINELIQVAQNQREGDILLSQTSLGSDFCTLVNEGVKKATNWFTILEFDDEFNTILFDNLEKEMEYKNDVSVFLSLNEIVDFKTNKFLSYGNEAPWASSFSNEIGYIDNDCLQEYFNFYLSGGIFNAQDWIYVGGLKSTIPVSFWYEFLLRLTSNNKKVYVIPKVGYKHYLNRENSLFDNYKKEFSNEDIKNFYELAKKEYQNKVNK